MTTATPALRMAAEDEFEEVVAVLVLSFVTDPVARWLHGGAAGAHLRDFPRMMRVLARDCANARAISRTEDGSGVALWLPPAAPSDARAMERAFGQAVPAPLQPDAGRLFAWTEEQAPAGPFWYLSLIGVDPALQGQGIGSALIADGLRRVDADRLPAYVWSSNPRNLSLYRRHGFETVAEARFGTSPPVTAMVRGTR